MGFVAASLVLIAAVAPIGARSTLLAENDTDAEIRRGVEFRRAGDDEAALREFQKAYAVDHSPRAAAQMGLAEQALGMWADAEGHLGEALRDGASLPWIQKNRGALTESLFTVKKHVARIEVVGPPPGATVTVSGRRAGTTPLKGPLRVNEGPLTIKVEADGWRPAHREVTLTGGQFLRLSIELDAAAPARTVTTETAAPGRTDVTRPPPLISSRGDQAPAGADLTGRPARGADAPEGGSHTWVWITLGVVAAAGAATGILLATRGTTTYPTPDNTIPPSK